jgi:hypothetical protein
MASYAMRYSQFFSSFGTFWPTPPPPPQLYMLATALVNHSRTLRSCSAPRLHIPLISNTLQDITSSSFNALRDDIRACCDYNQFCNMTERYLMHRVMNWLSC